MYATGLIEVILYARDMQAQVEFYKDVLGLRVSCPENVTNYSCEHWVTFDTGTCKLALHSGGTRRIGEGMTKVVFGVQDIQAARLHLQEHGTRMGPLREVAQGILVCDGFDPEGNPFSIETHH